MKTLILAFMMVVVLPSLLTAQVKQVQKNKFQTQKKQMTTPNATAGKLLKTTQNSISLPASISIKNITQLKENLPMDKLVTFIAPVDNTQHTNIGNPVYKAGSGVVLDAASPRDPVTGSVMCLWGVTFNPVIIDQVNNKNPFWLVHWITNRSETPENITSVAAYFQDMPTSPHLFMLTLGTTVRTDETTITIVSGYDNRGNPFTQTISGDRLIRVPGSLETKVLFTTNATYCPSLAYDIPEFGDNFSTNYALLVLIYYKVLPPYSCPLFHHIQLVQLD